MTRILFKEYWTPSTVTVELLPDDDADDLNDTLVLAALAGALAIVKAATAGSTAAIPTAATLLSFISLALFSFTNWKVLLQQHRHRDTKHRRIQKHYASVAE